MEEAFEALFAAFKYPLKAFTGPFKCVVKTSKSRFKKAFKRFFHRTASDYMFTNSHACVFPAPLAPLVVIEVSRLLSLPCRRPTRSWCNELTSSRSCNILELQSEATSPISFPGFSSVLLWAVFSVTRQSMRQKSRVAAAYSTHSLFNSLASYTEK